MAASLPSAAAAALLHGNDSFVSLPGSGFVPFTRGRNRRICPTLQFARVSKISKPPRSGFRPAQALQSRSEAAAAGPTDTTEKLTTKLEKIQVVDPNGKSVPLISLWEGRTAVVAFARHFGCVLCRKRADLLVSRKADMDAAGVALVLIAPGTPAQAKTFTEQTKFPGEVYADPEHASYDALEFVSGIGTTFTPGSGVKIFQAYMEGYRQDWSLSFEKHTRERGGWLQGGILVAGPTSNNLRYLFKDKEAGDEPDVRDVVSACCGSS